MYASQIAELINKEKDLKKVFKGVYARDTLPYTRPITLSAYILNSDVSRSKGEHWLLVYVNPREKSILWFDCYAKEPKCYGIEFVKWLEFLKSNEYKVFINRKPIQSMKSRLCGLFTLYILYHLVKTRKKLSDILKVFDSRSKNSNDAIVIDFFWKKYRFNGYRL